MLRIRIPIHSYSCILIIHDTNKQRDTLFVEWDEEVELEEETESYTKH